jgi:2-haloacid dehalogenase
LSITLAFDVYGTLIDTHGIIAILKKKVGSQASEFSHVWREKQLEYSFRRGLMQNYENFSVCTSQALDYASAYFGAPLGRQDKDELLNAYRVLPAFDDVELELAQARKAGFNIFAFSNGSEDAMEMLLTNAGIRSYFLGIVSVDAMKSFKPNPGVYSYFLRKSATHCGNAWLVSSNSFDVIGAISSGMRSIWVQRSPDTLLDPWGIEPTITVNSLSNLTEQIMLFD